MEEIPFSLLPGCPSSEADFFVSHSQNLLFSALVQTKVNMFFFHMFIF